MILVENARLSPVDDAARDAVLDRLRVMHHIIRFGTANELAAALDAGLDELQAAGYPRGLTRVVLFADPKGAAAVVVARRVLPGASMVVWPQPEGWRQAAAKLPELTAAAKRHDPGWQPRRT